MALLVVVLLVVIPVAELYVLIQVGAEIGVLNTIGLLILVGLVGGWVAKRAGLGVARRIQRQLAARQVPSEELVDGLVVLAAAVLLILPGFLSDVVGIVLLLPPVRAVIRKRAQARLGLRVTGPGAARIYDVRSRDLEP